MKKLKFFVLLLAALLILPFAVYAEDEYYEEEAPVEEVSEESSSEDTSSDDSKKVNVYLFRGEGCPHCQEAEEWFKSIEGEYGSYFKVVDYETWYNEDNAKLMQDVASARGEEAEGVPYIIIGDKSWNGFAETYEEDILNKIKEVYAQDVSERYDIMNYLPYIKNGEKEEEKSSNDVLSLIIIIVVAGGIGFGIYQARKKTN